MEFNAELNDRRANLVQWHKGTKLYTVALEDEERSFKAAGENLRLKPEGESGPGAPRRSRSRLTQSEKEKGGGKGHPAANMRAPQ